MNNLDFARVAITARLIEQSDANVRDDADHRRNCDHIETLTDIDREARRTHLQALADQHLTDKRHLPPPESCCARDARIDSGDDLEVTDKEIFEMGAGCSVEPDDWVERLEAFCKKMTAVSPTGQRYSRTTFKDTGESIFLNADGSRSIFCDLCD